VRVTLRTLVELILAFLAAKRILLPLIVGGRGGFLLIHLHSANRIFHRQFGLRSAPETQSPQRQDRIQRAIDAELSAKGWQKVQSGGDASVAAVGSSKNEQQLETFYNGFGGGWFWHGFPDVTATTTVTNIPIGSLQVDIFDSASKKLIWRGSGEKAISGDPEKNEKKLQDIVNDMFKHFPPSSKG